MRLATVQMGLNPVGVQPPVLRDAGQGAIAADCATRRQTDQIGRVRRDAGVLEHRPGTEHRDHFLCVNGYRREQERRDGQ